MRTVASSYDLGRRSCPDVLCWSSTCVSWICLDWMRTGGSGSDPDSFLRSLSSFDNFLNFLRVALNRDHCMRWRSSPGLGDRLKSFFACHLLIYSQISQCTSLPIFVFLFSVYREPWSQ